MPRPSCAYHSPAFFRKLLSGIRTSPASDTGRSADLFGRIFQEPRAKLYLQDLQTEKWPRYWQFPRYCQRLEATIVVDPRICSVGCFQTLVFKNTYKILRPRSGHTNGSVRGIASLLRPQSWKIPAKTPQSVRNGDEGRSLARIEVPIDRAR